MKFQYRDETNGSVVNRYPVDNDTTMWCSGDIDLQTLINLAKEKWPDVEFSDIEVQSVNHHQYSIYYDLHDSSDYVQYIVLGIE